MTTFPLAGRTASVSPPMACALAVVRRVRRVRPRGLLAAAALLGVAVAFSALFAPAIWGAPWPSVVARLTSTAITAASILLAVLIADEAVERGARRWPAYAVAVLAGATVGALLGSPLRALLGVRFEFLQPVSEAALATFSFYHRLDQFVLGVLLGGLATFVHVNRRTALAARRRQHDAELARARAQRRTLESQLQALQARVEPMFLFDTLARIRALYHADATAAGAMLDDLIVYLRAALPHLRESTSSLDQEVTLARSWLDIVGQLENDWAVDFAISPEVRGARLPALVLLPLLQCAVATAQADALRLRVSAHAADGRLWIDVATSTPAFAAGVAAQPTLAQIDERLRALHAGTASFEARAVPGGSRARIALPLEAASIDDEQGAPP